MKRMIKAIICALSILAFVAAPVSAASEDGYVSTLQFCAEVNGDVNGDGIVNSLDAALVLQYDAGLIEEFVNKAETPVLTDELKNKIQSDYYTFKELTPDPLLPIEVEKYYGSYDGWDAVYINEPCGEAYLSIDVAGYMFFYYQWNEIKLCKDAEFYDLSDAYDQGLITKENVLAIGLLHGTLPKELYDSGNFTETFPGSLMPATVRASYGDANGDGKISNLDASVILKYDAGLLGD